MTRLLTPVEIAERSLRLIGTFPITETAAAPEEVQEALYWLDMLMGHVAGNKDVLWLVQETLTLDLVAGQQAYNLSDLTPAATVVNGVAFLTEASFEDAGGNRTPLKMIDRKGWEKITDPDREGTPEIIYVDRLKDGQIFTYPTWPADATDAVAIKVVAQTYSQDFTASRGNTATAMRASWNLWAVTKLAHLCGKGPVRRLPDGRVAELRKDAETLWDEIFAGDNREHSNEPSRVEPYDIP